MTFHVPAVDITAWVTDGTAEEKAAVAAAIDTACREVGFIQILGHGIPTSVTDGLASAMDDFFAQDLDTKKRSIAPKGTNRGYTPPKAESLSLSLGVESATRMNDFFEAFNVGLATSDFPGVELDPMEYAENVWPDVAGYKERIDAYFSEAGRVATTLTDIFAAALDLPDGFFDAYTDHSIDVLRMNNYALPPGTVDLDGDLIGMSEHTDFGIVTVLWADQVKGLQVLGSDGSWNDVSPADDALLVNLGDLTSRWTNERWMSTLHRVKPPIVDGTINRRRSAAYFHDGNADATIAAIPSTVEPGTEALYPPITVSAHIQAKLAGSRAGKINTSATREAARVLAANGG
ncbi:isopenicillin N synthase-like dioxygenase [Conyzicola lurida]|uniref:Isopenicillin N synthase-like dioxygenase n=1 Tax=Conyzicola lurida TaxID=1172621 RepID=A0A841APW1_9MICO|nr:isopenicillin N synthase family oxygenase [Conyzicola lurida]MBB5843801.1 isopenicillin N synthase-like dioxygenase [Conyzicola lurida]